MDQHTARRIAAASAAFALTSAVALTSASSQIAAQTPPRQAAAQPAAPKAEKAAPASAKSEQAIAVLVNDEPITAYEIQQRTAFLALNSGGGGPDLKAKAEARWAQMTKDPKLNERLQVAPRPAAIFACRFFCARRTSRRARRRWRFKKTTSRSCSTT